MTPSMSGPSSIASLNSNQGLVVEVLLPWGLDPALTRGVYLNEVVLIKGEAPFQFGSL
jgi:hypothetical protein